jgi:hypothetical protein
VTERPGAGDDADPATVLGGDPIKIHKANLRRAPEAQTKDAVNPFPWFLTMLLFGGPSFLQSIHCLSKIGVSVVGRVSIDRRSRGYP